MSKTIEECGGYAFPDNVYNGMTLRDWFAGQSAGVMMAALSNDKDFNANPNQEQFIAERAYELADALLEVRGEITD